MDASLHEAIAGKLEAGKTGRLAIRVSGGMAWPARKSGARSHGLAAADQNDDAVEAYLSGLSVRPRTRARDRDRRDLSIQPSEQTRGRPGAPFFCASPAEFRHGRNAPEDRMTAPLKSIEGTSIADAMADIGRRAKAAARRLRSRRRPARRGARRDGASRSAPAKPAFWRPTPRTSPRRRPPGRTPRSSTGSR